MRFPYRKSELADSNSADKEALPRRPQLLFVAGLIAVILVLGVALFVGKSMGQIREVVEQHWNLGFFTGAIVTISLYCAYFVRHRQPPSYHQWWFGLVGSEVCLLTLAIMACIVPATPIQTKLSAEEYYNRGARLLHSDPLAAKKELRRAVELNPDSVHALLDLSDACCLVYESQKKNHRVDIANIREWLDALQRLRIVAVTRPELDPEFKDPKTKRFIELAIDGAEKKLNEEVHQ